MSIEITFHGHACFELAGAGQKLVIDPFLAPNNPVASTTASDIEPTCLVVTHGHVDHIADAVPLAGNGDVPTVALVEVAEWLGKQGVQAFDVNLGGSVSFEWGSVRMVPALHTNTLPDGTVVGQAAGVIIRLGNTTVYHTGDTALFSDMALIGEMDPVDVLIVPIGDRYTMDPGAAARAVGLIKPRIAIPCHYNTFPPIEQDPQSFADAVDALSPGVEVRILNPGESTTV